MFNQSCPVCQVGQTRPHITTYIQAYAGTLIQAPNMLAWKCDVCGETYFDPAAVRRLELLVGEAGPPPNRHHPRPESVPHLERDDAGLPLARRRSK